MEQKSHKSLQFKLFINEIYERIYKQFTFDSNTPRINQLYGDQTEMAKASLVILEKYKKKFHDIRDGDTPEILSYKLYGTPEKHWIILLMNDIVDPLFDWPLKQQNVINFVNSKYSANASVGQTGYEWAASNIHSYYKIETQTMNSNGQQNISKYQIDANTY